MCECVCMVNDFFSPCEAVFLALTHVIGVPRAPLFYYCGRIAQRSRPSSCACIGAPTCSCLCHHAGLIDEVSALVGHPPPRVPRVIEQPPYSLSLADRGGAECAGRARTTARRRSGGLCLLFLDFVPPHACVLRLARGLGVVHATL